MDQNNEAQPARQSGSFFIAAVNQRIPLPNVSEGFCSRPGLISGKPLVFLSSGGGWLGQGFEVPQNALP